MKILRCPKCNATSGDAWRQCKGCCPMPVSPHYTPLNGEPEAALMRKKVTG